MDEIETFITHGTFEFIDPALVNQRPIKGKWVFRKKPGVNGSVVKRKARLITQGFT